MTDTQTSDWDPRAQSVLRDQRHAYDDMRERCPVAYSEFLNWSLFRHAEVVAVAGDPARFSSVSHHLAIPNGMDPPDHTRYRDALAPCFAPDVMTAIEPRFRAIAAEHVARLDALRDGDHVDFVAAFAEPYSIKCLCAFLGWPISTWERLQGWTHGNQEAAFSRNRAAGAALASQFAQFVDEALRARREAAPASDDITSRLMATNVGGHPLTDEDIVSVLRNWAAGHGTVAASLGIVVLHLAEDQDLQRRLRREPALLPSAIEEILRVDGPLVANRRTATQPVEIDGRAIGAGGRVSLNWIAANRDPRAFDDPDVVRLDRDPAGNLLFGAGIHYCLGAPLARLELRVAADELLARAPRFELRFPDEPGRAVFPSNGLVELPLRLQ